MSLFGHKPPARRTSLGTRATFAAALAVAALGYTAADAQSAPSQPPASHFAHKPPRPALGPVVRGHSAAERTAAPRSGPFSSKRSGHVRLPAPGTYQLGARATARSVRHLHGIGIAVQPTPSAKNPTKAPGSGPASVSVLQPAAAQRAGFAPLALAFQPSRGSTRSRIKIRIPQRLLSSQYGGNYASRLHWVRLTTAGTDAPALRAATRQPVATRISSHATNITAVTSARTTVIAAVDTPTATNGTGTFSATSLKQSDSWNVSPQTGAFNWSYGFPAPPPAAGPQPSLSLSYDSQSVDGETGGTNNQAGPIGDGWSLAGTGFIERTYTPCAVDDGATGPVTTSSDLCWHHNDVTVSFGGHSGQLISAGNDLWKFQNDDGTRIQYRQGTGNGCGNDDYQNDCWVLTTTDGTQYWFGRNKLPGWASGNQVTNSVWTVPVFGNDPTEPGYAGANNFVQDVVPNQPWRWNLDYVVDPNGNSEAYYYDTETNRYAEDGTTGASYIRAGYLDHIDYGMRAGHEYDTHAASDKVVLGEDPYGRCSDFSSRSANCTREDGGSETKPASAQLSNYPDTPWDEYCASGSCDGNAAPTFWTAQMLSTITTQAWTGTGYSDVDKWKLVQSFPDPGDGTDPALWLNSVAHTGEAGSGPAITLPSEMFSGETEQNRVWVTDGLAPLDRYRVDGVTTETGAIITVDYTQQDCTAAQAADLEAHPQTNSRRCFPENWTPDVTPPQPAQTDMFNIYAVSTLVVSPHTGGANDADEESDYYYTGQPAWRFDTSLETPDALRTWSDFAGFSKVEVRAGNPNQPDRQHTTDYLYYQGMANDPDGPLSTPTSDDRGNVQITASDGSSETDLLRWAGEVREEIVRDGASGGSAESTTPIVSDTIDNYWSPSAASAKQTYSYTAQDPDQSSNKTYTGSFAIASWLSGLKRASTTEPTSDGGSRSTATTTTYDSTYGLPTQVQVDHSDASSSCTTTSYAQNTTAWLIDYPARVYTVGTTCAASATTAPTSATAVSDEATYYDNNGALGAPPTSGNVTKTAYASSYTGTTPDWTTSALKSYDPLGRVTAIADPRAPQNGTLSNPTTAISYTPATSGPLTSTTTTNIKQWQTTVTFDPARGKQTSIVDPNGKVTTATYDALGRTTAVWTPAWPQSAHPDSPSAAYSYSLSHNNANSIETTTLAPNAATLANWTLYDGLDRAIQTQEDAENGGTLVQDTYYGPNGQVAERTAPYFTNSVDPSGVLFQPATTVPGDTRTVYDGAGRVTSQIQDKAGSEAWRTSYSYLGADRVDTTPPDGGITTSTYDNSLGQTTKLVQYLSANTTGTPEATTYGYDARGDLTTMRNPAGSQWTWAYDLTGRQVQASDPDTGTTTTTYYADGDQQLITDNRGRNVYYTYDQLDRPTAEYQGTSGNGTELASWTYDDLELGQPTASRTYDNSGNAYTEKVTGYNDAYQPTGTAISVPPGALGAANPNAGRTWTSTYTYNNADGSLATKTEPAAGDLDTEELDYYYDSLGNLNSIWGTNEIVGGITYTYDNKIAQELQARGSQEISNSFYYDNATSRLTRELTQDSAATGYNVADRRYAYDNAGNITHIFTTASSVAGDYQCFTYDHQDNLDQAWTAATNDCTTTPTAGTVDTTLGGPAPYWQDYNVNAANGNRTTLIKHATDSTGTDTRAAYAYPSAASSPVTGSGSGPGGPNAVATVTSASRPSGTGTWTTTGTDNYSYNADGSATSLPGQTRTYNALGSVSTVQLTSNSDTQTDIHDASGNLLLQSDPTGIYAYLGDTELYVAAGSSTVNAIRNYTASSGAIAQRTSNSDLYYLTADDQDTATAEMNSSDGTITRRYFDPFGQPRGKQPKWTSNFQFLNQPRNTFTAGSGATTLTLGARDYNPWLGKFLSADPQLDTTDPQQTNGYSYANNNPVTKDDPTGQRPIGMDYNGTDATAGCWGTVCSPAQAAGPHIAYDEYQYAQTVTNYQASQATLAPSSPTYKAAQSAEYHASDSQIAETLYTAITNAATSEIGCAREETTIECGGSLSIHSDTTHVVEEYGREEQIVAEQARPKIFKDLAQASEDVAADPGKLEKLQGEIAKDMSAADTGADASPLKGPGPGGGESSAAAYGRAMHASYNYGPGFEKEFTLESGQRVDAVNFDTREVVELKPNNPRAIRLGTRQVQGYADQLNQEFPGTPFTYRVVTYGQP